MLYREPLLRVERGKVVVGILVDGANVARRGLRGVGVRVEHERRAVASGLERTFDGG